jgi:hypothetical protein
MSSPAPRLAWIDNLRTLVILLVVNMHACVTYSHVGGWYLKEAPEPPMAVKVVFVFRQGHLQAFFMGLLFFLSGVFAHRSFERRGPGPFLRERCIRLGLPSLLYMLVIQPFILYTSCSAIRRFPIGLRSPCSTAGICRRAGFSAATGRCGSLWRCWRSARPWWRAARGGKLARRTRNPPQGLLAQLRCWRLAPCSWLRHF